MVSIVAEDRNLQATYNVNASAKAAFRLKLRKCLRRFHFLVDFCRVVDIDPSVMGCGGQELALWADSQSPMFACFLA